MSGSHPTRKRRKNPKRAGTNRKRSGMKLRGIKGGLPAFRAATQREENAA